MEFEVNKLTLFELKYCERCGGLWLREAGDEEVYCPACVPTMAELPMARKRRKAEALPLPEELERKLRRGEVLAVCDPGGNA